MVSHPSVSPPCNGQCIQNPPPPPIIESVLGPLVSRIPGPYKRCPCLTLRAPEVVPNSLPPRPSRRPDKLRAPPPLLIIARPPQSLCRPVPPVVRFPSTSSSSRITRSEILSPELATRLVSGEPYGCRWWLVHRGLSCPVVHGVWT
jgi:hypothetical protein